MFGKGVPNCNREFFRFFFSLSPFFLSLTSQTSTKNTHNKGDSACLSAAAASGLIAAASGADEAPIVQAISVFDAPRVDYDPVRRQFSVSETSSALLAAGGGAENADPSSSAAANFAAGRPPGESKVRLTDAAGAAPRLRRRATLGSAADRAALYLQRFYFLSQRVERNALFARRVVDAGGEEDDEEEDEMEEEVEEAGGKNNNNAASASSAAAAAAVNSRRRRLAAARRGAAALTDVRSLLARPGATAFVLGCVSQLEDGRFFLEDPTGRVPLDLRGATTTAGFFCENCVVLAEGELHPATRVFTARALGMPPVEPREETLATVAAGPDWFGGRVPGGRGGGGAGGGVPGGGFGDLSARAARALAAQAADGARRCYFLADVGLCAPGGVDRLVSVLRAYEALVAAPGGPPPPTFVLMGDFFGQGGFGGGGGSGGGSANAAGGRNSNSAAASSSSSGSSSCESSGGASAARAAFASLGVAIATTCRTLAAGSDFVFIPGPGDTAATGGGAGWRGGGGGGGGGGSSSSSCSPTVLLPAPPLPAALVAPLRATLGNRAHFPSNPARLRIHAREVVVFRSDVAARLRAAALLPPNSGHHGSDGNGSGGNGTSSHRRSRHAATGASATFEHAALTLLQQAHLCPLPLDAAPVSWDADGGLRLYPLPHALVLAGGGRGGGRGAARGCDASFEGVECFDPGSFSKCGSFRGYAPADGSVESCCAMPEGEEW